MARLLYGSRSSLVLRRTDGALCVDGEDIDSVVGTKQGCTLGAFLFCVGLHYCLLVTAALHPTTTLAAYMDDVHTQDDVPAEAWAALCTFRAVRCGAPHPHNIITPATSTAGQGWCLSACVPSNV